MKEFQAAIGSSKRNETFMKNLMGRNLAKIREKTGLKGTDFITYVQRYFTDYKQSEIYFMMKFHNLCVWYPRLSYVTIGTGVLKSRLGQIKKMLRKEEVFWQHVARDTVDK